MVKKKKPSPTTLILLLRLLVKAFSFCSSTALKSETTTLLLFLGLFFKNSQVVLGHSRNSRPNLQSSEFLRLGSQVPSENGKRALAFCRNLLAFWFAQMGLFSASKDFWNGGNGRFVVHFFLAGAKLCSPCTRSGWEVLCSTVGDFPPAG